MFFACEGKHPKIEGRKRDKTQQRAFSLEGAKTNGQMEKKREKSFSHDILPHLVPSG